MLLASPLSFTDILEGVLIIANCAVILFTQLGLSGYMPIMLLALWTTASFPGNCFTTLFVGKFGRRKFMLVGSCGILVSLICECALRAIYTGGTNKAGQRAAIFIYFFILFWSSCFDATQYLYMSEIFPTDPQPRHHGRHVQPVRRPDHYSRRRANRAQQHRLEVLLDPHLSHRPLYVRHLLLLP
jgi:MFS family permease